MIKSIHFLLLTIIIGIISQLVHPTIETWIPLSIATYALIAVLVFLGTKYFRKRELEKAINLGTIAIILFVEYAIVTVIAYVRIIDDIVAGGPEEIIIVTIGSLIALILTFHESIEQWVKR